LKKVGIIGAGKIGGSLLLRLVESGGFDLGVSDIHPDQLRPYQESGVRTTSSNQELAEGSDLIIAAVKPWDVAQVMEEISPCFVDNDKAITSVAAGVSIARISEILPQGTAILRVMPNVCASVGLGSAVVTANEAGRAALPTVMDIFRHVGDVLELPERLFDAATALHGSGPAYVALFADALIQAGVREGIPRDVARRLVIGTIGGTAVLLKERSAHQVRDEVMTPGGTTAAAFVAAIYDGVEAATERARRLGG
jgi:pyrroline-5-carboxylate reductase